jgi:adenosylcobinamide kinase / adenosylcobinamide-phosphate guanylyltransferase
MEKKTVLITGGCRSGKSHYALDYANRHFSRKLFLATCEVLDDEMAQRVENHRKTRGPEWETVEEPVEIVERIKQYGEKVEVILIDCVTLWLSNLLMKGEADSKVMDEVDRFVEILGQNRTSFVIVSNEVGMGIVPADPLSRRFRDLAGTANQRIVHGVDTVIFMVSGLPLFLKGKA